MSRIVLSKAGAQLRTQRPPTDYTHALLSNEVAMDDHLRHDFLYNSLV